MAHEEEFGGRRHAGQDLAHIACWLACNPSDTHARPSSVAQIPTSASRRRVEPTAVAPLPAQTASEVWGTGRVKAFRKDTQLRASRRTTRCSICQCWVGGGDQGWSTHASGKCHQRQLLSIKSTGKPGHLIVSTFEQIQGQELLHFRRHRQEKDTTQIQELQHLQHSALLELLQYAGPTSREYSQLATRFEVSRLEDAWIMLTERRFPRRFFGQFTANAWAEKKLVLGVDAPMLAAISWAMITDRLPQAILQLDVLHQHPFDYSAILVGLILVSRALCHSDITTLRIKLTAMPQQFEWRRLLPFFNSISETFMRCTRLRSVILKFRKEQIQEYVPMCLWAAQDLQLAVSCKILQCRAAALSALLKRCQKTDLPPKDGICAAPALSNDVILIILNKAVPLNDLKILAEEI